MGITVVPREIEGHGYSFFFSQGAFMISVKTVIARESGLRNRKNLACVQSGVLGPVVRTPVSANPGLNFNPGFFFLSSKAHCRIIFSILFRVSNHQIEGKEN